MIQFYYGSDTFTLSREIKKLKTDFIGNIEMLEISDLTDAALKNRITEALQSQSLFAEKKLVILKNFLGAIKDYPKTEEYLSSFLKQQSDADVIFVQAEKFDRRLKLFKTLLKSAQSKEFNIPIGRELETWVENYLGQAGFKIDDDALREFVSLMAGENEEESLCDLWQVSSELEKLMLLFPSPPASPSAAGRAGDGDGQRERSITINEVKLVVQPNIPQNVFALTNLFAEGKTAEAQRLLEALVSSSPTAELKSQSIQIIGALASQIRSLLLVKDLEKEEPAKIAESLGWKEGRVWINSKLSKKFSKDKLISMMRDLRALDLRLKTSEEPPKLLLSLFLQKGK